MDTANTEHRLAEVATYIAEAATTVIFARYLHRLNRTHEPDWTWLSVLAGVIISSAPAITLARVAPACWRRYEGRVVVGFLVSGAVIIPWQVFLAALAWGQRQGYTWGSNDQATTMERTAGDATRRDGTDGESIG